MIFPGQLSESDQEKSIYISLCALEMIAWFGIQSHTQNANMLLTDNLVLTISPPVNPTVIHIYERSNENIFFTKEKIQIIIHEYVEHIGENMHINRFKNKIQTNDIQWMVVGLANLEWNKQNHTETNRTENK